MAIWSSEIKELEKLTESLKGQLPDLEKELGRLIKADDENMILLYSRRCLEVIITDLCECELKRPRKTEPLKGILDKLHKEEKVPSNIITSMDHLNSLSAYGAHPKDFEPEQVRPVLINLAIILNWYLKYKDLQTTGKAEEVKSETKQQTVSPPEKSIIVLPFENISSDPEQEYFSDGLTEEIITDLSHIEDLLVISRSSAMTFKGAKSTIKEITNKVHVRYVLEGSVRKAGNNLRITAQLIDGMTDTHLWAEKYEETLDNVFYVQQKISNLIANSLQIKLTTEEKKKLKDHSAGDLLATECWFRAKQEIHKYTAESFSRANNILENGLKENGDNELLLWGLGYLNWFYVNMGIYLDDEYLKKAEHYVKRIFELNKESFYGYQLQGLITYKRGDTKKSIFFTQKALDVEPNNPEALNHIIWMYADTGKTHKSYDLIERLLSVDPLTSHNQWAKGWTFLLEGKIEEGLPSFRLAHELDPENFVWKLLYAHALLMARQNEKALDIITPLEAGTTDNIFIDFLIFIKNAFLKDREKTLQSLKDGFFKLAEWDEMCSWWLAQSFALIGENEKALYWIEYAAFKRGFINYPFFSKIDPFLENIRGEERFKKLMERVKYEWENLEV
jgi:TolB-like protein